MSDGKVHYTNRKKRKYWLHKRFSKKGTPCYYFSAKQNKERLVDEVPDGWVIWEHPESFQPFLRKVMPRVISLEEEELIQHYLEESPHVDEFMVDVRGSQVTIYAAERVEPISQRLSKLFGRDVTKDLDDDALLKMLQGEFAQQVFFAQPCVASLRFTLVDEEKRLFSTERWCCRGSIDDWIDLPNSGSLKSVCEALVPHIGQESFYDLSW
ncbi:Uncharacterized protein SCG7086_AA_00100 [Chlamydiales bacterium SCGC AG-110-P3]|nr:Uncharacterized protein SCG7086_AA_00100 [Chlamydiales bacterium SCGC AG-110-P3]